MAPLFRLIKDVDRNSRHSLKLRVVRIISRSGYDKKDNKSSLEIVFHDQEGGQITGIVKKINVKLFDNRLTEGRVYGIRNYCVENDSGNFRTSLAKFKIVFNAKTMLAKFPDEHFSPDFMFDFRPFSTLADINNVDETLLFDVIGKVNEIHNPQEKEFSEKRARLIEIILEDLSGHHICCTLWGSYVDQILTFESNLTADPPVLILQMCRAKIYKDKVTLSNSFEVTQIHTKALDIEKFRSQIKKDDSDVTKSISRGSLNMSKIEMADLADGKLIFYPVDNFFTVDEACSFWICSIISSFIGDWWYLACTRCQRKLREADADFWCDGCRKPYKSGVYRYSTYLYIYKKVWRIVNQFCNLISIFAIAKKSICIGFSQIRNQF
ncbi:hypothetical protein CASFOL_027186 [Castilleja foliolosa]|uniref:Replication protein A 70 kDa DNA-binding subunit B/D first OB fold domain-containing protein n=1 Tax=Castilleja foliolosa TaxID=1961234 RepID=A0ABD3CE42_9LAMI